MMPDPSPAAGQLRIDVICTGKTYILKLAGSADMESAETLQEQLLALLEDADRLILDLSELDFISSVGLGAMVTAHMRSRDTGGEVRLVAPKQEIRKLLEVTQLDKLLKIHDTCKEAMSAD